MRDTQLLKLQSHVWRAMYLNNMGLATKQLYRVTCMVYGINFWGDGTTRREFLFVEDLVDFLFFVLEHFDRIPDTINVGLGYDYSIDDYYNTIKDVVGYQGGFKHDLTKPTGMSQKLVDTSLQQSLGWMPKTQLKTGIECTYEFFLKEVMKTCYH